MIGHLDCSSGVSGDKFLGAVLDAGETTGRFCVDDLKSVVNAVAPDAEVTVRRTSSHGISALQVRVESTRGVQSRRWWDIRSLLIDAALPETVRGRALAAFALLAEVEGRIHDTAPDDVHFHEIGAVDSIVDILGSAAGLEALGIQELVASPVAVGSGVITTSHGSLGVPAPATAALLIGVPVTPGPSEGELTTPTGAALLKVCVDRFGAIPPSTPVGVGYGAGSRDIGSPNVCRLLVAEPRALSVDVDLEIAALLETNVDHISPEAASVAAEQLLAEGALDVWITPVVMKKGRAAFTMSVLVGREQAEVFSARIMALTGSLGVRFSEAPRFVTSREVREVKTSFGSVRFKVGAGRTRPEAEDVARIAKAKGEAFGDVEKDLTDELGQS